LRRRRAERLVPVPCPRPGSVEPDPSPRLLRLDEPLPPLPDVDAFGEFAFPLAAEPRPLPEDRELDEPEEPLRGRSPWRVRPPRRERSRLGRAPTGRTRARTRASTRTRPKRPILGSLTTMTSASPGPTPS
jgi:hypothetical protein